MSDAESLFKQRNYLMFIAGRLLANIGAQMQTVAVGWLVYSRTGSALDLGLIGLSQFAPFVLLILPAGYVADHFDRRRVLQACYALQTLCALGLLGLILGNVQPVWPIFVVMSLLGIARAFGEPARQSFLPRLVPASLLGRATAFSSAASQTSTILGPVLGGFLFLAGAPIVMVMVALCTLAALVMMTLIRIAPVLAQTGTMNAEGVLSGLKFVWSRPLVLGAISLDLFAVLFGGATALLPIFAHDVLHVGPTGLGLLRGAVGVGAVGCALYLSVRPIQRHVGAWLFGSVAAFGLSTLLFGISTNFWLSLVAMVMLGATDMLSVFVRQYLLPLVTPDHLRGRVSAVSSVFIGASNELGEFESGVTAAWWGAVPAVLVGGGMTVLVSVLWLKLFPDLRRLDRFPEPAN